MAETKKKKKKEREENMKTFTVSYWVDGHAYTTQVDAKTGKEARKKVIK